MKTKFLRVILFFLVIIIIPAFTFWGEKETVSYNENKTLAEFPKFSFESYKNRSFMNGMSDFFSDHFVLRESFIKIKNSIEKAIGKTEINGVVEINSNLVQTFRDVDYTVTDRNLVSLNKLKAKNPDIPFYFMPIITAQELMKDSLPRYLDVEDEAEYIDYCFRNLENIEAIDVSDEIAQNGYAFYRTDHHWTTESAYSAYKSLGSILGFTPFEHSEFRIEKISDEFRGTLYSKTLNEDIASDSIIAFHTDTDFTFTVKDKIYNSLYFDEFVSQKDKYSYFLGGNHGICTVENKNGAGELLIIKDSYANCIIPFLAEHYAKITIIDPRYCSYSQIQSISPSRYEEMLVLFNVSGFSQEQNFALIEFMGGK